MKAYKGFNKDMTCRGFQYEEGKTYETDKAKLCTEGFHACENPLDCFAYYEPGTSVYREVEIEDNGERHSQDSKVVGKKITIGAELSVAQICKLHFEYTKSRCTNSVEGEDFAALEAGDRASVNAGYSASVNAGNSASVNAGDSASVNAGNRASVNAGEASVLRGGVETKFKGGMHSVFACEVRDEYYNLIGMKTAVVDGKKILPDVWYTVKNGKWVRCKEETK